MEKELLSRTECAVKLGVSVQTIYRWERAGKFVPSVRFNKLSQAKYLKDDVDNWIRNNRGRANA
tara:strand:+ start:242 stop:433 length:192 start_codon:yes stop_codon:yes gene_type:complete